MGIETGLEAGGGDDVILSDRTATQAMSDWNFSVFGGILCFADNYTAARERRLLA